MNKNEHNLFLLH